MGINGIMGGLINNNIGLKLIGNMDELRLLVERIIHGAICFI